jgi:hypothetical protein
MFDQLRTISPALKLSTLVCAGSTQLREIFSSAGTISSMDLYSATQPESNNPKQQWWQGQALVL